MLPETTRFPSGLNATTPERTPKSIIGLKPCDPAPVSALQANGSAPDWAVMLSSNPMFPVFE